MKLENNKHQIDMKAILILIIIITNYPVRCQEDLKLVSGTPFFFNSKFPSARPTLFDLQDGKLDTLAVISQRDSVITTFIKLIPEKNYLVIHQEDPFKQARQFIMIGDTENGNAIEYKLDDFQFLVRQALVLEMENDSIVFAINKPPDGYYAYSFKDVILVNEKRIKRIITNGCQGIALHGTNWGLPIRRKADSLFADIKMYSSHRQIYIGQLPSIKTPSGTHRYYYALSLNTDSVQAIICYNSIPSIGNIGKIGYLIKPAIGDWYYHEFKGGLTALSSFGSWVAGAIADYNRGTYYLRPGEPIQYDFKRSLPGLSSRRPSFRSLQEEELFQGESENFNQRAASLGYFWPGTLFLFNIVTKQYREWETGQADSEILLVANDCVWYRSDDEIFFSRIEKTKLSTPTKILKDDRVRDIHWAYLKD